MRRAAALALCVALAAFAVPCAGQVRHLPADQVAEHLVSVALREWNEWGRTLVDARDGRSRIEHQGARETDSRWIAAEGCDAAAAGPVATASRAQAPLRARTSPGTRPSASARTPACAPRPAFDARERVRRYWIEGVGGDAEAAQGQHPPWSAAFVSWLMQAVGLSAPAFVADAAHSGYLRALGERASAPETQFELLLAADEPLRIGDLVCGPRDVSRLADRVTLLRMDSLEDLQRLTSAHCDLVVRLLPRSREAQVIGGNVADSVAMTRLPLTGNGRVIRTLVRPSFLVVRAR